MTQVGRFVDIELLIVDYLTEQLGDDVRVVTLPPDNLAAVGDLVWVVRAPGLDDWETSSPRVDLQSFVPGSRGAAWSLAGRVHDAMRVLGGRHVGGQLVDSVRCTSDPVHQFWSADVDRVRATYEPSLRVA